MKYLRVWINGAGQRINTQGLSINQNSYDNTVVIYTKNEYDVIDIFFKQPNNTVSPRYHMIPMGYEYQLDDADENGSTVAVETGYYVWTFPIPYTVTSFTMSTSTMKLDLSVAAYYRNSSGVQLSPTMANAWISVVGSTTAETLDSGYNAADVDNLWETLGKFTNVVTLLNSTAVLKNQIVTDWSATPLDTNIPSEKLTKDSLDLKLDDSQLITEWTNAAVDNIANAQMTLTALNSKIPNSSIVTSWSNPTLDTNIPSEKLVKASLDAKLDDSQLVTSFANPTDDQIPSAKLVYDQLGTKLASADFNANSIVTTLGTTPVNRAISDANGLNISTGYVKVSQLGAADGVATLDSNKKVPLSQIPDSVLGQMLYAGTIDGSGTCTLSNSFKAKYNINSLTISSNMSNPYDGSYWIATSAGSILASDPNPTISYQTGDWIVSNGSSYTKIDNTDAVQGVKGNAEISYRTGEVNLTPADIGSIATADLDSTWANTSSDAKVPSEKLVYSTFIDHIGKLNQLDFTGTLSGDTLIFELTNGNDEITLIDNNVVECDLHFAAAGTLSNATKMIIHYGAAASVINITNILNNTGTMLVGDMKQLEKHSNDTGFRWIFNAVYNSVNGLHFFGIPATVVREDILAMTDVELATHIANTDLEKDQLVFIYSVGTGNGFYLGHTYKVNGAAITDVTAVYPHVKADATTTAVALTPVSGEEYRYGTISSLTLTLPTDIYNHHSTIAFTSGATATTVSFPTGTRVIGMHVNSSGVFLPRSNTEYLLSLRNDGNGNLCVMAAAL